MKIDDEIKEGDFVTIIFESRPQLYGEVLYVPNAQQVPNIWKIRSHGTGDHKIVYVQTFTSMELNKQTRPKKI